MSGPKTSRYYLTEEQRRLLREARELERKTKASFERKEQLRKNIMQMVSATDSIIERAKLIVSESKKEVSGFDEVKQLRESVSRAAIYAGNITTESGLTALQNQEKILKDGYQNLTKKKAILERALDDAEKQFRQELNAIISSGFELSFANIGNNREVENNPYIEQIKSALDELADLHISEELNEKWKMIQNKASEIRNVEFIKNFYAMTVLPFVKECKRYSVLYEQYGDIYENLLQEYALLAKETGTEIKNIPFSELAIEQLKSEIAQMEQIITSAEEQSYISKCIDEVMVEMGYDLIGSREVTKKSGKHFHNELYLFDEGTAVNVTRSDDGQTTMELGGLDNVDRIPTNTECQQLCDVMEDFCEDYAEIEKRLAAKGIKTKRIAILPPEEQYAQIINMEDYDMKGDVEEFEAVQKRQQRTSNASLRKEV